MRYLTLSEHFAYLKNVPKHCRAIRLFRPAKWSHFTIGCRVAMPGERDYSRIDRWESRSFLANGRSVMPGPSPLDRPAFPAEFLEQCRGLVRRRTVSLSQYQRARLALLLHESPAMSNVAAGAVVELHPNSVRLWRHRWARGDFSLADQAGRGRKPDFSPSRPGRRQGHRL